MVKALKEYQALVDFIERNPCFSIHNDVLFCDICNVIKIYVPAEGIAPLKRHIRSRTHNDCVKLKSTQSRLNFTKQSNSPILESFDAKLVTAFAGANIPLYKLINPKIKAFLEEFTGRKIKDESFYRRNMLEEIFKSKCENLKNFYMNKPIYLVFHETTDASGLYILNILIGECSKCLLETPSLVKTVQLPKTNSENVNFEIIQLLTELYDGNTQKYNNLKLLLSDGASYAIKAGTMLKSLSKTQPS